jgi:hypothetical protein
MSFHRPTPIICVAGFCAVAQIAEPALRAQAAPQVHRATDDSGFAISCEVFCSATRLRTGSARIRWSAGRGGAAAQALAANARQAVEATVFYQGFEKDLFVTLPVGPVPARAVPAAGAAAQGRQGRPLRAFDLQIVAAEPRAAAAAPSGEPEMSVVVEGLEPGATYTWRVVIDAAGRILSPTVTCEAPVCPADMADEAPASPRPPQRQP